MPSNKADIAMHFVETRTILFGECDPAGILYTPRICEYIVESALRFTSDALGEPFERYMFARGLTLPARNFTVDFLKPLTWDDKIDIRAGLDEIRKHAYTIRIIAINKDGETAFSGRVTQVCVESETKKIATIPEPLRTALERGSATPAA
ncbi:MAG: acyl-CoA thioesterase [Gammaproteobacteria bacterium]